MVEFKLQSENAKSPRQQTSIHQYAKAVRRKLYVLFAMLLLVIVMMKEARKPENWLWMGFENATTGNQVIQLNSLINPTAGDELFDGKVTAGTLETQASPAGSELTDEAETKSKLSAANQFWEKVWENLNTQDKTALVELVSVSSKTVEQRDIHPLDFDPLISTLVRSDPFDPDYAKQWENLIRPALLSVCEEEELDQQQQAAVDGLFQSLDPLILGELEDFTSAGRKSDTPAWFRFWARILNDQETEPVTKVSPVQLSAQSEVWRFKPIQLEGQLLTGRMRKAGVHGPLRSKEVWYEWWIGSTRGSDEIWCVYTADQPDAIEVGEKFSNFDLKVESSGLFYKVRSYVDSASRGNHCPLILAKNLTVTQKANPFAKSSWTPSATGMVATIVGMMVFAFAIAMWFYRSDKHRVHQPGGEHKTQIENHLENLADNPDVKSIAQRLKELP